MIPVVELASGAALIECGALPTAGLAALTVEGWFRVAAVSGVNRPLLGQYGALQQWVLYVTADGRATFAVFDAGGVNVGVSAAGVVGRGSWIHVAGCYDGEACSVWVNGMDATELEDVSGGVVAAGSETLRIGGYIGEAAAGFVGRVGWCRVSDVVRWPGTLRGPDLPPASDGDTLALWKMLEGAGATVDNSQGNAAYDGSIVGGAWRTSTTSDKWRCRPALAGMMGRRWPVGAWGGLHA